MAEANRSSTAGRPRSRRRRLARAGLLLACVAVVGCRRRAPENLVLVSIDTCRADALGCYGSRSGATPHVDALAAGGVVFANTISPVPITLPAHASILTGLTPARHGLHYNLEHLLHPDVETLAEVLARRGFVTAGFVSALVLDHRYGLDQGFGTWDDDMSGRARTSFGAERPGVETVSRALGWLETHKSERFFLFVHLYEPHEPYEPPPEFAARFPGSPYLGEVAAADASVGRIVARLRALDLDRSTVVAVVGDHGEMLGEHGEETHSYFIYQSSLRVPFVLSLPTRPKVRTISQLAGLIDVTPTLCGILGVPPPAGADGIDLSPLLDGKGEPRTGRSLYCESLTAVRYGAAPLRGLVGERWKFIRAPRPELYDLSKDRGETTNLVPSEAALAAEKDRELSAILARPGVASTQKAASHDSEAVRKLAALGYLAGGADSGREAERATVDPKDMIDAHLLLTQAMQSIAGGRFDEAEPFARRFLEKRPASWEANLTLGRVALGRGEWARAIPLLERSLELKPAQFDALTGLGAAFEGLLQFDRAAEAYRRSLPLDPEPPRAAFRLAGALTAAGNRTEAEQFLAVGAPLAEGKPAMLLELGGLLERLGRREESVTVLQNALELARADEDSAVAARVEKQLAAVGR